MGSKWNTFNNYSTYFGGYEKISILFIPFSLFMFFASVNVRNNRVINIIASATFGVYLISDNYVIQKFLWIKNYQFQHSEAIIIHSIVAVALVYIICTIIDLARQITFEKQFMYIANKYGDILLRPGKRIINICKKLFFGV